MGGTAADDVGTSHTAGNDPGNVLDNTDDTAWQPTGTTGNLVLDLGSDKTFNTVNLKENIEVGQRTTGFAVNVWDGQSWKEAGKDTTFGYRRILKLSESVTTSKVRLRITSSRALPPAIATVSLHNDGAVVRRQAVIRHRSHWLLRLGRQRLWRSPLVVLRSGRQGPAWGIAHVRGPAYRGSCRNRERTARVWAVIKPARDDAVTFPLLPSLMAPIGSWRHRAGAAPSSDSDRSQRESTRPNDGIHVGQAWIARNVSGNGGSMIKTRQIATTLGGAAALLAAMTVPTHASEVKQARAPLTTPTGPMQDIGQS